jgi:hypothetical protein
MSQAQDRGRAEKTLSRMRSGGLQPPAQDVRDQTIHVLCDGCGESIDESDRVYTVTVGGVFDLRLHEPCYAAWLDFRP